MNQANNYMKLSNRCTYVILMAIILFAGCLPQYLLVPVERPAEIDLEDIKNVAVRTFTGVNGRDVSEELKEQLNTNGHFSIVSRSNLNDLINEYNLAEMDGLIDQESAIKLGNLEAIEAIINGRVIKYNYDEDIEQESKTDKETGERFTQYTRTGIAIVEVLFEIQDLETGLVLSSKRISRVNQWETSAIDDIPNEINSETLLNSAKVSVVSEFIRSIAPHTETMKVTLLNHRKIPELDRGIDLIRIEEWDEALELFKQAAVDNPKNPKVLYNLGIVYKYTYQFDKAEKYLKEAYVIRGNNYLDRLLGGNNYEQAIIHLRQMREDQERLQQQLGMDNLDDYEHYESLDIAWVQRKLNEMGYNCGVADGIMGSNTRDCIESFQEANGFNITGSLNQETTIALNELR